MLTIAIISLVAVFCCFMDCLSTNQDAPVEVGILGAILASISVIAWWNLCFPLAIVLIVVGAFMVLCAWSEAM